MAIARSACVLGVLVIVAVVNVSAQWPLFIPPDVPRGADGRPNLDAPAPRLPNGKPDFSGVWESRIPPSGRLGGPFLPSLKNDGPPVATFVDIGRNIKEGLPLTPAAAALKKSRMSRNSMDNPDAHCLPMGFMQLHTHSQPRKIVHTKDVVVIAYEANYGLRWLFTDGRTLPANDPNPFWYGYSVGRWNGDELVVETTGLRDDGWLDVNGTPFGSTSKITERFRRVNYGRIEIDVTVDDPTFYTKPVTVRVNWRLYPDGELIEFICNENEQSSQHLVAPK
ncbi:MAG TPA: hypothetical protein VFO21_09255 [Vicinamibacterales bacterium]|nr:hypothetical protein [Vicinamibacterales bacterium]